jgi:hypothetical protein
VRRHRLPEPFVVFVDECLGRNVVPDALRGAITEGERVEVRAQGTLDLDWIPAADAGGWVCFTKDHELRRRPNELAPCRILELLGGRRWCGPISEGEVAPRFHKSYQRG